MKVTSKFLALALMAVAMVFASCSKDDDSAQKGADNFSHDIIGMWEGVERTGDEADGNAEARIAYFDDGTYIQYSKLADVWFPRHDDASEYNIEGNKLTSRWKPLKAENYNSEWWNIDAIKDGVMKWSARRERKDGSQYTSTFNWKKVDDTLTSEQIMAKLPGAWAHDDVKEITLLKGKIIKTNMSSWDTRMVTTFTNDGKSSLSLIDEEESTNKILQEYTYAVKGNVLFISTIDKQLVQGEVVKQTSKDVRLINAISDDELILVEYNLIPEQLLDVLEGDGLLTFIRMRRVK